MSKYNNDKGQYLALLNYPAKELAERCMRDQLRVGGKYHELNRITNGGADNYFFGEDLGFWDNFYFDEKLEKVAKGRDEAGRLRMCEKVAYFYRIEPKLDKWIEEAKQDGRYIKNNSDSPWQLIGRWFTRFFARLYKKKQ